MSIKYVTRPLAMEARVLSHSLYKYVKEAWPYVESNDFIDGWHVGCICEHLEAVSEGKIAKLLINIPPGCSKSLLCAVMWPTWEWTRDPKLKWFFASYDQELSTRDSLKCRTLIKSRWYQERWGDKFSITDDQDRKTKYDTDHGGYRLATSVGGHGTGEHPHRIVVDDPHSVKRAESEVERQAVLTWWDLTMSTRGVAIDARRVIIMQRLHKDDLSAHVLRQGGWEHINLCMRHEKARMAATCLGWNDPRKEEGELLCPNQFDEPKVSEMEKRLGAYGTAGQLQQRPVPKGGSMFKAQWFSKRLAAAPFDCKRIRFWDRACIAKDTMITALREGEYKIETIDNCPIILPLVQARQLPIQDIEEGDAVLTAGKARANDGRQYAVYDRVVWSGQTGKDEEIVTVMVKGARSGIVTVLSCTKEHVVFLLNRQDEEGKGSVRAWDLKIGDHVILCADFAFYDDKYPMPYGEVIDVTLRRHDPMIDVYDIETEVWHQFFANGILVHNSTADGGCFTAGTLLAKDMKTGAYYIEHVAKGQWEPAERNAKMRAIAMRDRAKYGPKHEPVIWVEREGGSSGRDAWLGVVRALEGFVVKEATVTGSKDVRAEPWATQLAAGNVYVVDNGESQNIGRADWDIQSYIEEHELFRPDPGKRLGSFKDQVDSSCLLGLSLIITDRGDIPIRDVVEGDCVMTRQGWKRVLWSGVSGRVYQIVGLLCHDGSEVYGTFDHLVLTQDDVFTRLGELTCDDTIYTFERELCFSTSNAMFARKLIAGNHPNLKPVLLDAVQFVAGTIEAESTSTIVLSTTDSFTPVDCLMENTIGPNQEGSHFTRQFGNIITRKTSPKAMMFITRTETLSIIHLRIWNACQNKTMQIDIQAEVDSWGNVNILIVQGRRHRNGMDQKKGENGIRFTARRCGENANLANLIVAIAEGVLNHCVTDRKEIIDFAPTCVKIDSGMLDQGTNDVSKFVRNAITNSKGLLDPNSAPENVLCLGDGKTPVYDLNVEDAHEFFANGILVHNSGAYNLFAGQRALGGLRVYNLGQKKKGVLRIVVCTYEELPTTTIQDHRCLLIDLADPPVSEASPDNENGDDLQSDRTSSDKAQSSGSSPDVPVHALTQLIGSHKSVFADIEPKDYQGVWNDPVPPWNQTPDNLILTQDVAKRLWAFLMRRRDPNWEALVIADKDGKKSLSVAMAIADMLRLPRDVSIYIVGTPEMKCSTINVPNLHVYEMIKATRHLVVG